MSDDLNPIEISEEELSKKIRVTPSLPVSLDSTTGELIVDSQTFEEFRSVTVERAREAIIAGLLRYPDPAERTIFELADAVIMELQDEGLL